MLQRESKVRVGDNSGVTQLRFIRVLKVGMSTGRCCPPGRRRYAYINDVILASVIKSKSPTYKKGQLVQALIVNSRRPFEECHRVVTTQFHNNLAVMVKVHEGTKKSKAYLQALFTKVSSPVISSSVRFFLESHRSYFKLIV